MECEKCKRMLAPIRHKDFETLKNDCPSEVHPWREINLCENCFIEFSDIGTHLTDDAPINWFEEWLKE